MIRRLAFVVLVAVAVPACGSSSTDAPNELVSLAAEWQCDRQRFAFDSLDELDAMLAEVLAGAGVTAEEFASFEAQLSDDDELRAEVREAYGATCG